MFQPNHRVLDAFVRWLENPRFDQQHAKNWANLYRVDPEAAMCEATFWAVLADSDVDVEPNAILKGSKQAPDFRCTKHGSIFYVEVTCIRTDTATNATGMVSIPDPGQGAQHVRHLNGAIFNECKKKTPQCAGLDAPCILAVGTFHFPASTFAVRPMFMEWLLTGEVSMAQPIDAERGGCVGEPYQKTSFESSTFTRLSKGIDVEHARLPISALLVGGLGCSPPHVYGLLHPMAARAFEPRLLDRIPFCKQYLDRENRQVGAEWVQRPND